MYTKSQRAMIAAKLIAYEQGANCPDPRTWAWHAKTWRISRRTLAYGVKVNKEAAPELADAVHQGYIKVSDAARVLDLPHDEQRECLMMAAPHYKPSGLTAGGQE